MKGPRDQSSFGNLWGRLLVRYPVACGTTHSAVPEGWSGGGLGGGNPGVSAPPVTSSLSPPTLLPTFCLSSSALLPSAAQRQSETGRGSAGKGSRAGLTLWPPTAGAEAATRPASLRWKAERAAWQQTQERGGLWWREKRAVVTYCAHLRTSIKF